MFEGNTSFFEFRFTESASKIGAVRQDRFVGVEAISAPALDLGKASPRDHAGKAGDRGNHLVGDLILDSEDVGGS